MLVYKGQCTYTNAPDNHEETKKTIKVCKELCRPYKESHHVINDGHFHTSVDLVKELKEMDLYMTGTMMSNRTSKQLRTTKQSREFKEVERGDHKIYVCKNKTNHGENFKMGLMCWKDRDIVYCLTNATNTAPTGHCFCCSQGGRICIGK